MCTNKKNCTFAKCGNELKNFSIISPALNIKQPMINSRQPGKQYQKLQNKEEQIVGTREKSQQIVAQRLLSCLQYPDATKSSAKDLSFRKVNL